MAINPYYIPARQPLKQWGKDQYVPLPIEDMNRFRTEVDKKRQPLTDLESQFIEGEVFKSDIPAFQQLQSQANQEISALADNIDKYDNPIQYEREARKIVNKYTKPLGSLLQQKQYKDQQEAMKNKFGSDAFFFGGVDPTQASYTVDPNTGALTDAGYDPTASYMQRADHLKSEQNIADRVVGDVGGLGLTKASLDGYLRTGTFEELDQNKINRVLTPENLDSSIAGSPELQQRLRILTEQNSLQPHMSGSEAQTNALAQVRDEIKQAAYQNVYNKLNERYMVDQVALEEKRRAAKGQEKLEDLDRSQYVDLYKNAGKGKGTNLTNDNIESLGKYQNADGTYIDNSQNKIIIPAKGDPLQFKLDEEKNNTYIQYDDLNTNIDDSLNALLGLNKEIAGLGDNATSQTTSSIKKYLKEQGFTPNKEGLKKAILKGYEEGWSEDRFRSILGQYPGQAGSGDNVGAANFNDLLRDSRALTALGIEDEEEFLADRERVEENMRVFDIGKRISNRTFNSEIATNTKGTNARNINGNLQLNWKGVLNKEDLEVMVQDGTFVNGWDDVEFLFSKNILEGNIDRDQNIFEAVAGGFDASDLIGEEFKLNYASEEQWSEQQGENYDGSSLKKQGRGTLSSPNVKGLANQRAQYSLNNAKYANSANELFLDGKKALKEFQQGSKPYNALQEAYNIKDNSDRMVRIREVVEKYGIQ